jgi:hypothetical protein
MCVVNLGWNKPHNDWTTLDPAIVSGQVADNLAHNAGLVIGARPDSPSNWIKANLDQLTGDSNPASRFSGLNGSGSSGLIPGLAGLNLGGPQQQQALGHWGQPSPVMANTPPPGFALNRGQMGMQPMTSQPHPFPSLANLGGGGGAGGAGTNADQIESELSMLVRS